MSDFTLPAAPANMPRTDSAFGRWFGRTLLRLLGWRIVGSLPNEKQLVLAGAPHTSNWDFVIAMAAIMAIGVKISFLMKKEAFFWPFKNLFMALGGIPLDRSAASDTVEQICLWYRQHTQVWVAITPEGTRAKVDKWKTGFLRIAEQADVPVFLVTWNYPSKTLHLERCWRASGDHGADAEQMRAYLNQKYVGRHPEKQ